MKEKAILVFEDENGKKFTVELGPAENVRTEAREEIKAYTGEGYALVGYHVREVLGDD